MIGRPLRIFWLAIPCILAACGFSDRMVQGGTETTTGVVSGRVLGEDGGPAEGAEVKLSVIRILATGDSASVLGLDTTDASGRFLFTGVAGGRYAIYATGDSSILQSLLPRLGKAKGDSLRLGDVELAYSLVLKGRVLPPDGTPPEAVKVCIPGLERCVEVGKDSVYSLTGAPQGEYDLAFILGETVAFVPVLVGGEGKSPVYIEDIGLSGDPGSTVPALPFYDIGPLRSTAILPVDYDPNGFPAWYTGKSFDDVRYFTVTSMGILRQRDLEDYGEWLFSRPVTVNTTASGMNVTEDIGGFPLLVRLSGADFDFSQATRDGKDIRFSGKGGNHLPFEVERWDADLRVAEIWVRMDTIFGDSDQQFRMHWGKAGALGRSDPNTVFDAASGFEGVWHLGEVRGTSGQVPLNRNSVQSQYEARGTMAQFGETGQVGKGHEFKDVGDMLGITGQIRPVGPFSLSVWAKADSLFTTTTDPFGHILVKNGNYNGGNPYGYSLHVFGEDLVFMAGDGTTAQGAYGQGFFKKDEWIHAVVTYDGSGKVRMYRNGVPFLQGYFQTKTAIVYENTSTQINDAGNDHFFGTIDEVRISNGEWSPARARLSYENQK